MEINIRGSVKRIFIAILVVALFLSNLGATLPAVAAEISSATDVLLNSLSPNAYYNSSGIIYTSGTASSDFKRITVKPIRLLANKSGSFENGYFKYQPTGSVECLFELDNGTSYSTNLYYGDNRVYINGRYMNYYLSFISDQSYYNQWRVGNNYTATLSLSYSFSPNSYWSTSNPNDKKININADVSVIGLNSLELEHYDCFKIIEGTSQITEGGVSKYYPYHLGFKIHFTDGSTFSSRILNNSINVLGHSLPIYFYSSQSEENQWTVGNTYWGQISVDNQVYASFNTKIIGIESFEIEPITITENTQGYDNGWYYEYEPDHFDYSISYTDGSSKSGYYYNYYSNYIALYPGETSPDYYWSSSNATRVARLYFSSDQGVNNPWQAPNTYTGNVELRTGDGIFLKTAPVQITILDSKYKSIEIIDSKTINANDYSYIDHNGNKRYQIPEFTYKINFRDGNYSMGRYPNGSHDNPYGDYINVTENQHESPWTSDGENKITVKIGSIETSFSAKLEKGSDYEYIEENGGLFITDCSVISEDLVIPDTIDEKPVIGIVSLGNAPEKVKNITVPNSVKYISEDAFGCWNNNLETIHFGSSVNGLTVETIANCYKLKSISVSKNNPYYTSADGIVYNKKMDTLVLYPLAKGNTYYVPNSLINIDALSHWCYREITSVYDNTSTGFRTLDGVTYTADMKKVISCVPDKTGSYNMPTSVIEISQNAFYGSNLTSVIISKNVTEITYGAFSCSAIESITLPDKLQAIDEQAFSYTGNLKSISLPSTLTELNKCAFAGSGIESITIPASVNEIGESAFADTFNLTDVTIKNGVEKISAGCFAGSAVNKIVIPNSVKYLGSGTFYSSELSEIKIGSGLSEINSYTFWNTNLSKVIIPKNISIIHDGAFCGCDRLQEVIFENDSVKIGMDAFAGCPLKEINLGENVSEIGMFAFSGNAANSVVIPDSVTKITYGSFANAENLVDIDIPDNISSVCGHAFDNTAWYDSQPNGLVYLENVLYGIKGSVDADVTLKQGTTVIADYAFENSYIETISLPDTIKTIGEYAFHDSKSLKEIYIPASVNYIGEHAFAGCSNLDRIEVDPNNKKYSSYGGVLFNKDGTELIYCPNSSRYSGYRIAYTIPDWVKFVRNYAFEDNAVQEITISNDKTLFDEYAFALLDAWGMDNSRVLTFVCDETSNAYAFAKSRMYRTEELPSIASGYCGDNIQWKLSSSGKLKITGKGEMYNYKLPSLAPWYEYRYKSVEIIVSEDVTKIGNNSFNCFYNLETVYIKNPDTQFGWYVFDEETTATIKALGDSSVEDYANKNGITFVDIRKPNAPKIEAITQNRIELVYDAKYEYSTDGVNWQTSNVFTNIEKNTVLYFYQRTIGNHLISDATKCMIVSVPEVLVGNSSIHVNPVDGFEYALDDGIWQTSNIFEKYIVPEETYTVYQRPIVREGITILYDETGTTVTVNGDDKITDYNSSHLVWLKKILLLQTSPTNSAADINNDGRVNVLDLIRLKKLLAESN